VKVWESLRFAPCASLYDERRRVWVGCDGAVVRFTHLAEECNDIMLYGHCVRFAAQHWDGVAASPPFANLCKLFPLEAKKLSHDVQALAATRQSHEEYDNSQADAQSQDARSAF
jgi:hypothetical protein